MMIVMNNNSDEEESDSKKENDEVDSFLDYIEKYEVLLSCFIDTCGR